MADLRRPSSGVPEGTQQTGVGDFNCLYSAENVVVNLDESVSRNPDVMSGELVFAGTRVSVKTLFDYLAGGHPLDEFLAAQ